MRLLALLTLFLLLTSVPLTAGNPHSVCYNSETDNLLWFIQASDTHLGATGTTPATNLQWLTGPARAIINPSFIVVTGDLTDSTDGNILGYPNGPYQSEWTQYREILDGNGMTADFYFDLPGNHDAYSDPTFSYYLANSVQGRATGRTQLSWTRSGPWGKYHFIGINSADNTGAPFSVTWPFGDNAGLDSSELAFIGSELNANPDAGLTLIFGHHPLVATGSSTDTYLLYGKDELLSLIDAYGASLYGFGHTHVSSEQLFAESLSDGFAYLNVASWQRQPQPVQGRGHRLQRSLFGHPNGRHMANGPDHRPSTVVSARDQPFCLPGPGRDDKPGARPGLRSGHGHHGTVPGQRGKLAADGTGPCNPRLWQGSWNAATLAEGEYTLEVQASTGSGVATDSVTTYVKPTEDSDGDGVTNSLDNCPLLANQAQTDTDEDGLGDLCDPCPEDTANDSDGDGLCGNVDNCPLLANATQTDTDDDGVGDSCDADADGDGFAGTEDNCPLLVNPTQADTDGDGRGDLCDPCPTDATNDSDGDGLCGILDNCPLLANPQQTDTDGDGLGDSCDADVDGDGLADTEDNCPLLVNPTQTDLDGDGLGDLCDSCPADAANDSDGDGICGNADNCPLLANPQQTDTDADGFGDRCDPCPTDAANDSDGDGICDASDNCPLLANPQQTDTDGDGSGDLCDLCPTDAANDSDGDGICDASDNCPLLVNPQQTDTDGDGLGDLCDSDQPLPIPIPPQITLTTSGADLTLSWPAVTGAAGYTLVYAPAPYVGPGSIGQFDLGSATSFHMTLWDGAAYYLAVKAYNSSGSSDLSNIGLVEIKQPPPPPPVLTISQTGQTVQLTWTPVEGATGYSLYYAPLPFNGEETIDILEMGRSTNARFTLWEGASFALAVEALRGSKRSGYSNVVQFTIGAPP